MKKMSYFASHFELVFMLSWLENELTGVELHNYPPLYCAQKGTLQMPLQIIKES